MRATEIPVLSRSPCCTSYMWAFAGVGNGHIAANQERHDHAGEHYNVAQRQGVDCQAKVHSMCALIGCAWFNLEGACYALQLCLKGCGRTLRVLRFMNKRGRAKCSFNNRASKNHREPVHSAEPELAMIKSYDEEQTLRDHQQLSAVAVNVRNGSATEMQVSTKSWPKLLGWFQDHAGQPEAATSGWLIARRCCFSRKGW